MEFLYFQTIEEARKAELALIENRKNFAFKMYSLRVTLPASNDPAKQGRIKPSIDIDSNGQFYQIGLISKFSTPADSYKSPFIKIIDESNSGYLITGQNEISLDTISNIGKESNQALTPYFPMENVYSPSSKISFELRNEVEEEVDVEIILVGFQYFN